MNAVANHLTLMDLYGPTLARLNQAAAENNSELFHRTLEALKDNRADDVTRELRVLAETLHDAMLKFRHEFRIATLAEHEVPGARARLCRTARRGTVITRRTRRSARRAQPTKSPRQTRQA